MLYPIGIQNFEKIREGGYVYVDKTALIHRLATSGVYYFLSRPRRFGKSLLVSTIEAYFSGKKELFKGLALEQLEKDWIEYPVLHLDLNGSSYLDKEVIDEVLNENLSKCYRCRLRKDRPANQRSSWRSWKGFLPIRPIRFKVIRKRISTMQCIS